MTRCAHRHLSDSCMTRGLGAKGQSPVQCPLVQHSLLEALHTDGDPRTILWSALWLCMWYEVEWPCGHCCSWCMHVQIIAVHADDPEFKGYDDISQLPKHRLAEIRR